MVEITLWIAVITALIVWDTASMAEETADFIASHTASTVSRQFSQMKRNGSVMMSHAASRMEPISMTPVCTTFLIVSHTEEKKLVMPFHTLVKKVLTEVHTADQLVPNQPRKTSTTPRMVSRAVLIHPSMPFQTEEKTSFTPFQA